MQVDQQRVEQVAKRFRKINRLILLGWCVILAVTITVVATTHNFVTIILLYLAIILFALLLLGAKNSNFQTVNRILYDDCDPLTMAEVYGWLNAHRCERRRIYRQALVIYAAQGMCMAGDFVGMRRYIEGNLGSELKTGKVRKGLYVSYLNLAANCYFQEKNLPAVEGVRVRLSQYLPSQRKVVQRAGAQALEILDGTILLLREEWEEARLAEEKFLGGAKFRFQQVSARYGIAFCDLKMGRVEAARDHLEFVARFGGTMYQADKARRALECLDAGEQPVLDFESGPNGGMDECGGNS